MLPDFVADLRNLGVNTDPLFRSAEHYIEMWEKAELWPATSSSLTWVPPPPHSLYVSLKYDNATPQGGAVTAYAADWNTGAGVVGTLTVSGVQEPLGVPIPYMMAAGSGTGFAGKGTYGGLVPPVAVISAPGYTSTTVNLAPPTFLIQLQLKRTVQPGAREPCGDTVHGRGCQAPPTITLIVAAVDAQTGAPITNGQFTIAGEVAKFGQSVNYLECLPPCIGIARAPGYQDAQFNDAKQLN